MALSAKAIVRIAAVPDSSLNRVLGGTVEASRKASRQIERDFVAGGKARERAEKQLSLLALREAKQRERTAAEEARYKQRVAEQGARLQIAINNQIRRDAQRLHRTQMREAERTARSQVRAAQQAAREEQRLMRQTAELRKNLLKGAAGFGAGAGAALMARTAAYAGAMGARSPEEMLANAVDFRRRTARLGDQAGMTPAEIEGGVLDISARRGVDAGAMLGGLETAQAQFSEFGGAKSFMKGMDDMAQIAIATGADFDEVVVSMGVMRRQLSLTEEQMLSVGHAMVDAGDKGNVDFKELSGEFVTALGALGRGAGLKGYQGAMTALGVSEVMGASDMSPAEAATRVTNLVTSLNKEEVRKGFKREFGVSLADKNGELRHLPTVIAELSAAGFSSASKGTKREKAVGDIQAKEAYEILVKQYEADPVLFNALMTPSAETGRESVARRVAAMSAGPEGEAATLGARQFATFVGSSQFDTLLKSAVNLADTQTMLAAQYPALAEAAAVAAGGLFGLGAVAKMFFGSGGGTPGATAPPALQRLLSLGGRGALGAEGAALGGMTLASGGVALVAGGLASVAMSENASKDIMNAYGLDGPMSGLGSSLASFAPAGFLPDRAPLELGDGTINKIVEGIQRSPEAKVTIDVRGEAKVKRIEEQDLRIDLNVGPQRYSLP